LFLVAFGEGHCAGHRCWHLHDPSHPWHSAAQVMQLGDPMRDVYRALDRAIGELIELAGSDTSVFVLSSHGLGPNYNGDHLIDDILAALGHCRAPVEPRVLWRALRWSWRHTPWRLRERLTPAQKSAVDSIWPTYDSRSNCFKVNNSEVWGGIRVNLAGREPQGRVRPGAEYDAFCAELARDFLALVNVDTGRPAVRRVERAKELYDGPKLQELPDLFVEWNSEAPLHAVRSSKTGTLRRAYVGPRTGHHRDEGVLFAIGPGIRPGRLAERVPIVDVAPTLSACLDVRLDGVEGRPIEAMVRSRAAARMSG
jgi:predicted AlkP superfamily phosphohydrolase/phosphomutase